MYLNQRPVLDYRFPFFAREAVAGSMHCVVKVWHTETVQHTPVWNPDADDPDEREPGSVLTKTLSYQGMARLSPNKDWRARSVELDGQIEVQHAVRVQLDMMNNLAAKPVGWPTDVYWFPVIGPGDTIEVTKVAVNNGIPTDLGVADFNYIVRNVSSSSNSWVRTLLCDIIVNDQSHGLGDGYQ